MPIERLVDHDRRLTEFVFFGAVTRDEIIAHRREMEAEDPKSFGYDALVDMRRGSMVLTTSEIREIARGPEEQRWPRTRCAFVTPHEPTFNDLRLFQLWASRGPREYRTFRSLGEACAWLGLERAGLCLEVSALG